MNEWVGTWHESVRHMRVYVTWECTTHEWVSTHEWLYIWMALHINDSTYEWLSRHVSVRHMNESVGTWHNESVGTWHEWVSWNRHMNEWVGTWHESHSCVVRHINESVGSLLKLVHIGMNQLEVMWNWYIYRPTHICTSFTYIYQFHLYVPISHICTNLTYVYQFHMTSNWLIHICTNFTLLTSKRRALGGWQVSAEGEGGGRNGQERDTYTFKNEGHWHILEWGTLTFLGMRDTYTSLAQLHTYLNVFLNGMRDT